MTITAPVNSVTPAFIDELNDNFAALDAAQVFNLAALKATEYAPAVVSVGYKTTPGDGWGGMFAYDASDTTTAGDDALVVVDATGRRWKRVYNGPVNAKWFGAKGDGVTNDASAINAAIQSAVASGKDTVILDAGAVYYVASTIELSGVHLDGGNLIPGNPTEGTRILGAPALTPVVTIGSLLSNQTSFLRNLTVTRSGTSPDSASIGIKVLDGYNINFENVESDNHGVCWYFTGHPPGGLSIRLDNCYSARAVDAHIWNDTFPELYWMGGRIGQNGAGDYAANTYVRMSGGVGATAGGPNTVKFTNVQFNQGSNAPSHFWEFVDLNSPYVPGIDATVFNLTDCHIEGVSGSIFYSDATWNIVDRLTINGCVINTPTVPMWALNAATQPARWSLSGNNYFTSTFTLAPTDPFTSVSIVGGYLSGTMSLTGVSGSTLSIANLAHGANFTLAGTWSGFNSFGETFAAGAFINNASGTVLYQGAQYSQRIQPQYSATLDGAGNALIAHGLGASAVATAVVVFGSFKTGGGAWNPLVTNYIDATNVSVSGGAAGIGRPAWVEIIVNAAAHTGW
jgi:hypothetical protein